MSEWIQWATRECPVPEYTFIEVMLNTHDIKVGFAKDWNWQITDKQPYVQKYKIIVEEKDLSENFKQLLKITKESEATILEHQQEIRIAKSKIALYQQELETTYKPRFAFEL